jgi:hypothetical protein
LGARVPVTQPFSDLPNEFICICNCNCNCFNGTVYTRFAEMSTNRRTQRRSSLTTLIQNAPCILITFVNPSLILLVLPVLGIEPQKKTSWSESASDLYRPIDRCFRRSDCQICEYRVPRGQRDGSLRLYSHFSRQEPLLFYQVTPQMYSRG